MTVNYIRKEVENCQPKSGKDIQVLRLLQCCSSKVSGGNGGDKLYIYI